MRKLFACLVTLFVAVSLIAPSGLASRQDVGIAQSVPVLKRLRPEVITAGTRSFTVRLEGKKFEEGAQVLLDGVALSSSRIAANGKRLLADVDAAVVAAPGTHTVQGMNPDGATTDTATLTVVPQDPNLMIRLDGNAAQEDLGVTFLPLLNTEDFTESSKVFVWSKSVPVTELSAPRGRVQIEIPSGFGDDPASIPITLRDKNGNYSNTEIFFVVPRAARLDSIDPDTVKVGTEDFLLKVFGNFKSNAVILVNNIALETRQRSSDGRLEATVPASLFTVPAQLFVRVQQDGIQSADAILSVTPTDAPFIYTIAPTLIRQGEGRVTIDIIGANFDSDSTALIDGNDAKVRNANRHRLTVVIPSDLTDSVGTHTVQVKDKDGNPTDIVSFSVVPDVSVSTVAGNKRDGFNQDCVDAADAMFRRPRRLALGSDGLLYLTDNQNHAIRTLNPGSGEVCTLAGTGQEGYSDSANEAGFPPTFSYPNGVALSATGVIYVTENGNGVVRRIIRNGATVTVETFAGLFSDIVDKARQKKLNSTRLGQSSYRDDVLLGSGFRQPDDILVAPDGSIFIADAGNHAIRRINLDGRVETIAGNGVPGFADGVAQNARFNAPTALALSADGNFLFVADTNNHRVRRVDLANKVVETFAGNGVPASDDGPPHVASFAQPIGLALDSDGTLYVSELAFNGVRRIDTAGNVSALAGGGSSKFKDGTGVDARFNNPRGLAIDTLGRILYVADTENFRIRSIALH
ncbi:MAG TPA: SMP-30/gluconolactonase/LRE family protein [Blastocatellia bacterium]|nr:SMP-30/gluconolactonase/LRE family protein [Blastocatellia bacterium]